MQLRYELSVSHCTGVAEMAFAPGHPGVDPYGTLRSLVCELPASVCSSRSTTASGLLHYLQCNCIHAQVPLRNGKAYGGKLLHNLQDTLKASTLHPRYDTVILVATRPDLLCDVADHATSVQRRCQLRVDAGCAVPLCTGRVQLYAVCYQVHTSRKELSASVLT